MDRAACSRGYRMITLQPGDIITIVTESHEIVAVVRTANSSGTRVVADFEGIVVLLKPEEFEYFGVYMNTHLFTPKYQTHVMH